MDRESHEPRVTRSQSRAAAASAAAQQLLPPTDPSEREDIDLDPPPSPLTMPLSEERFQERLDSFQRKVDESVAAAVSKSQNAIVSTLMSAINERLQSIAHLQTAEAKRPVVDGAPLVTDPAITFQAVHALAGGAYSRPRAASSASAPPAPQPDPPVPAGIVAELRDRVRRPPGRPVANHPHPPRPSSVAQAAAALPERDADGVLGAEADPDRLLQLDALHSDALHTGVAQAVLERATRRGSFYQWVLGYTWKEHRNRHEAIALSTAIDFLQEGKVDSALEVLCRRAAAIQLADLHNNWKVAERVEWQYDHANLLPQNLIAGVARDTAAVERIERAARGGASARGRGRGRSGRWSKDSRGNSSSDFNNYDKNKYDKNKNSGVGSKTGGAAAN